MKIKYTKWMVALTMTAMGVGMAAFSFNSPKVDLPAATEQETQALADAKSLDDEFGEAQRSAFSILPQLGDASNVPAAANIEPETEPETVKVDPLTLPLEKDEHEDIDTLVTDYLNAKLACSLEEFEPIVTDTQYIELDKLQRKTEYIEEYQNVESYAKPAEGDIDYIVYVYQELKITSIDTPAPALDEIYVKYDENGEPKVVLGQVSSETESYIKDARNTDEVQQLIDEVGDKLDTALDEDEALAEFCTKLNSPAVPKK